MKNLTFESMDPKVMVTVSYDHNNKFGIPTINFCKIYRSNPLNPIKFESFSEIDRQKIQDEIYYQIDMKEKDPFERQENGNDRN